MDFAGVPRDPDAWFLRGDTREPGVGIVGGAAVAEMCGLVMTGMAAAATSGATSAASRSALCVVAGLLDATDGPRDVVNLTGSTWIVTS